MNESSMKIPLNCQVCSKPVVVWMGCHKVDQKSPLFLLPVTLLNVVILKAGSRKSSPVSPQLSNVGQGFMAELVRE